MSEGPSRQRRQILQFGAALGLGALPLSSLVHAAVSGERRLGFYNLHTGESLATTYWADGQYIPSSAAEIDFIFRDFRTGDVKSIDFRLLDLLHDLRIVEIHLDHILAILVACAKLLDAATQHFVGNFDFLVDDDLTQ